MPVLLFYEEGRVSSLPISVDDELVGSGKMVTLKRDTVLALCD